MSRALILIATTMSAAMGCATTGGLSGNKDDHYLRDQAFETLKRGTLYEALASVRAAAVECLQHGAPERGLPWIRNALLDTHPGVRFAGCMAVGMLVDRTSLDALRHCLADEDKNTQVAAIFALHRLGDTSQTHRLAEYLLDDPHAGVRANAALVLGRMGESGALKLLAKLMQRETEEAVRLQALESLALLGSAEAIEQLTIIAHSEGDRGAFVLSALGELEDSRFREVFRRALKTAQHLETQMIAARALGRIGVNDGFKLSMEALKFEPPKTASETDPAWNQRLRIRQLAALALGSMRDRAALPELERAMSHDPDPRVRIAAARAILEIVDPEQSNALRSSVSPGGNAGPLPD